MYRYLETLFRHRLLLSVPILLVLGGAIGWVALQPPAYQSTTRLWVEKQQLVTNPNDSPYITPAQEQVAVLSELLTTRYFSLKVGQRSPLAGFLADPSRTQPAPPQRIMAKVGLSSGAAAGPRGSALDDAVFAAVSRQTVVLPAGPQIMTISFTSTDPALSAQVTQAIADQFRDETLAGQRVQSEAAVEFYGGQVKQAQAELSAADAAVDQYLVGHPDQRVTNAVADARMIQLRRDDDAAHQRFDGLRSKLDQAQVDQAALARSDTNGIRVLDEAEVATGSHQSKLLLEAGAVSLALALLLVLVGVLGLTLFDSTFRRSDELEQVLDLRSVGSVPRLG